MLAVHGGGYIGGSMHSHRTMFGHIAKAAGCLALIPDYRLAPEHIFPAALDDVLTSYRWLLAHGESVLTGDSFFHLNALGEPLPGTAPGPEISIPPGLGQGLAETAQPSG